MRNPKMLLLFLVIAAVSLLALNRFVLAKPTVAADETKRKWEYCRLMGSYMRGGNHYVAPVLVAATASERWEEVESDSFNVAALNKLGAEGWELVTIVPTGQANGPEYILKRPINSSGAR